MGGTKLESVHVEKYLRVIVEQRLSGSGQCSVAVKKGNRKLGCLARSIENKSKDIILTLYNTHLTPHLEYCVQF